MSCKPLHGCINTVYVLLTFDFSVINGLFPCSFTKLLLQQKFSISSKCKDYKSSINSGDMSGDSFILLVYLLIAQNKSMQLKQAPQL